MKLNIVYLFSGIISLTPCFAYASFEPAPPQVAQQQKEIIKELKEYDEHFMQSLPGLSLEELKDYKKQEMGLIDEYKGKLRTPLLPKQKISFNLRLLGAKKRLRAVKKELAQRI